MTIATPQREGEAGHAKRLPPRPALGVGRLCWAALAVSLLAPQAFASAPASVSPDVATPAGAPAPTSRPPVAGPAPAFDRQAADQILGQLQNQLRTASDDRSLSAIGAQAAGIEAQSAAAASAATRELQVIDKRLRQPPSRGHSAAANAERVQFAVLRDRRTDLQAEVNSARSLEVRAGQTFTQVAERRREGFSARVLEQSPSPLSPDFWSALQSSLRPDLARLTSLAGDAVTVAAQAPEPRGGLALGLGALLAVIVLWPIRGGLERLARQALLAGRHPGRFGRTTYAIGMTVVDVAAPVLAVTGLRLSAAWGGLLSDGAATLADALAVAVGWAAVVVALGRAIATDRDPARCVAPAPPATAARARRVLRLVAVVTAAGYLLSRLNYVVGASVAATIASNAIVSLAYVVLAGLALLAFSGKPPSPEDPAAGKAAAPLWTLVSLALGGAIVVTLGAVLTGFTTLAVLVSGQIFWLAVIAAAAFLLLRLAEDLSAWLFGVRGRATSVLTGVFRLRPTVVAQVGVLTAAILQVAILLGALSLALTPFGDSGHLLFRHASGLGGAIRLGSATVSPRAILSGLAAFGVGLAIVHLLRGWLVRRYLPVTGWDAGVRNSVSTGVGYLGVGIATLCAMAAMGLGLRQIALVASALSVGIGFGLQQVVQNFVSGVILLVERPVKVGDWVDVGGVEGDIRRIRVRATEIQTFDRTTVIVPNSDLITKQVVNKTRGDPRARVKLEISIATPADALRARDIILQVAADETEVLRDPKPAVYIDSLAAGGAVNFRCYLFVGSPRDVTRVRSQLYYAILEAFAAAGVAFSGTAGPQNLVVEPGPSLAAALEALAPRAPSGGVDDTSRGQAKGAS